MDWGLHKLNGTLTNTTLGTVWSNREAQYALDLDGSNDYVVCPAIPFISNKCSISLWAQWDVINSYQALFAIYTATTDGFELFVNNAGGVLFGGNFGTQTSTATGAISVDGKWHHVSVTSDGANWRGYLDGVPWTNVSTSVGFSTFTAAAHIGSRDGSFPFNGRLDDIRVYGRTLNVGEIVQLGRRRGIAYETQPYVFDEAITAAPAGNRRRRLLCGA
jgi:hypothetical protein